MREPKCAKSVVAYGHKVESPVQRVAESRREVEAVGDIVYTSKVTVIRKRGPIREARVPGRDQPVTFGVHSEIAQYYGISPEDYPPDATTLDYLVAAAAG